MKLLSVLISRSRRRRTYASLMQLDDHLLRDIGLDRAELRAALRDTALAEIVGSHARA